jgi:hypothetical protein
MNGPALSFDGIVNGGFDELKREIEKLRGGGSKAHDAQAG